MEARYAVDRDEEGERIEQLVDRIRARGGDPLPRPSPEAVAAFLACMEHGEPMSGEELEEHERMWRAADDEVQAIERSSGGVGGME